MSSAVCGQCGCPTPETVQVPGLDGQSSFTTVGVGGVGSFVVPALGNQVVIPLENTNWMAVGNGYFVAGAGYFSLDTINSPTQGLFTYLNIPANTATGNTIPAGAAVVAGSVGANGTDGSNSTTVTTANFIIPAVNANVTVNVADSSWMLVGQTVFASDGTDVGHFQIVSKADTVSFVGKFLGYEGDSIPGATIDSGAGVSPSGTQPDISGLGNNITQFSDDDGLLAYDITNSIATITGITVTAPAAGLYKVEAGMTVLYTGVTFAASRELTMRTRNTTAAVTISQKVVATNILTTTSFPAIDYVLPIKTSTLALNDVIELQTALNTVESAGSSVVTDAWISITPLLVT